MILSLQPDNIRGRPSSKAKTQWCHQDGTLSHSDNSNNPICRLSLSQHHSPSPITLPNKTSILINALITSRLDHWNAPLLGPPHKSLNKLQNSAACIIPRTHITPVLKQIYWLPVLLHIDSSCSSHSRLLPHQIYTASCKLGTSSAPLPFCPFCYLQPVILYSETCTISIICLVLIQLSLLYGDGTEIMMWLILSNSTALKLTQKKYCQAR